MRDVTSENITDAVVASFAGTGDARLRSLVSALVRHLHALARETGLTHDEWRTALKFLTEAAAITDSERNEFALMSDVLGLSSLVDLLHEVPGATEGSNLGPFHAFGSPEMANGANLVGANKGIPVLLTGRTLDLAGAPVPGALIDFWQAADNGLYPKQDPEQDTFNLRCQMRSGPDGNYRLTTIRPAPYTVPYDGPVGVLLRASGRHAWRPAHFHMIVTAEGHVPVVTELFPEGGDYLDSDAAFGVRKSLIVSYRKPTAEETASHHLPPAAQVVDYDFKLAPLRK